MDIAKKEKIVRFLNDPVMSAAVREVLEDSFKKKRKDSFDVHYLAAKSLSQEFLEDAWKDLSMYKNSPPTKEKTNPNFAV